MRGPRSVLSQAFSFASLYFSHFSFTVVLEDGLQHSKVPSEYITGERKENQRERKRRGGGRGEGRHGAPVRSRHALEASASAQVSVLARAGLLDLADGLEEGEDGERWDAKETAVALPCFSFSKLTQENQGETVHLHEEPSAYSE